RAVEYNLRAAEAAVSLFAFADAEGFACEALGQAGEGTAPWARARYLLATAELYLSRSEADVHAAASAAAFAALGDVDATAEAEILHARVLRGLGRAGDFEAAAERAFALVRDRPPSRVKAAALIGWSAALSMSLGRYQEAAQCAREALEIAEQLELV